MGIRLKQDQRHRLHCWLDSMPPADVWDRTARRLAVEAGQELDCRITPRIIENARRAIVPRPPKEPDVMTAVLTRLAQVEARLAILEQGEP